MHFDNRLRPSILDRCTKAGAFKVRNIFPLSRYLFQFCYVPRLVVHIEDRRYTEAKRLLDSQDLAFVRVDVCIDEAWNQRRVQSGNDRQISTWNVSANVSDDAIFNLDNSRFQHNFSSEDADILDNKRSHYRTRRILSERDLRFYGLPSDRSQCL